MVIAIDNIDNNHHRRHLVHLFMALPYRFFKKTRNRVEKEKANIDINLDEGEEEFKTLPEYYTTIHQVREGGGGGGGKNPTNKKITRFYPQDLEVAPKWLDSVSIPQKINFNNPCILFSFSFFLLKTFSKFIQ